MNTLFSVPGLVMLIGALIYLIAPANPPAGRPAHFWPRVQQIAMIMFACGLLVLLFRTGSRPVLQ